MGHSSRTKPRTTIPRLPLGNVLDKTYLEFLRTLETTGFAGETRTDYASRLVVATDNSVYQVIPQGVVFPRSRQDVIELVELAARPEFRHIVFSPRGGGTGTNGGSLGDGIVVDLSKHMNHILEVDLEHGWVRVEPGVVLDQLNAHLRPHGVFFAPTLAPSSRATIGGMISNDACGTGSRIYGRTSNHVVSLTNVLLDGTCWESGPMSCEELAAIMARTDRVGEIHRLVDEIVTAHEDRIASQFPKLSRFLTGYDLAHVYGADRTTFNLNSILAGSEGTLAFVIEAKLELTKLPEHRQLVVLKYASFDDALAGAQELLETDPGAIETIDETILSLAREDLIWHQVGALLGDEAGGATRTVNLVEFESDDLSVVEAKTRKLIEIAGGRPGQPGQPLGTYLARNASEAAALWELRKSGVGLLGNAKGERRPIPFVEDTAVPPEHLAAYVRELRAILHDAGLQYGMFGHIDVGCLHVRPALNMRDPKDEALLRTISDKVLELVIRYGGVMWGEHGKGYRSEYSPRFFGEVLYEQLRRIKGAFDRYNQMNPGKLATPASRNDALVSVDGTKRGSYDRQITDRALEKFEVTVTCNGNGACFNWDPDYIMCPSAKATRDRIHSPKGRAGVMREWLRQLSAAGFDPASQDARRPLSIASRALNSLWRLRGSYDFSHEVYAAMDGCLSCRACATQCPIEVVVPEFKAEFLELYHERYLRPLKDHFARYLEPALVWMSSAPRLFNLFFRSRLFSTLLARSAGIVDSPTLSEKPVRRGLRERNAPAYDPEQLRGLSEEQKRRSVLLLQDAFTTFYESNVLLAAYDLLGNLGYDVYVLPFSANGKGLHLQGFVRQFKALVRSNTEYLRGVARLGIPLVGIEPAVTLTYRDEYVRALDAEAPGFRVHLVQEWLADHIPDIRRALRDRRYSPPTNRDARSYTLMGHCTEKTAQPASQLQWREVFAAFGLELELASVGCCGMAGIYGHEAAHYEDSKRIYEMSWSRHMRETLAPARVLATGHSCRSQVARFDGFAPLHPLEALTRQLAAR